MKRKPRPKNALLWLFEPLEDDPRYEKRRLFSFAAAYLDQKIYLAVSEGQEPWNGIMVCTSHDRQPLLTAEFPQLTPHPVLGKWLYLSLTHPDFESLAQNLVSLARRRDPRLGVEPQSRTPVKSLRKTR